MLTAKPLERSNFLDAQKSRGFSALSTNSHRSDMWTVTGMSDA